MEYQGSPVYTLDVVGGTHNALVSFYVDKKLAGTGNWISGTNQRVDIRCSYKDQQKRNYKFWMPHIYGGD